MRFIDLFAGLGGFHLALEQLGHECVFASELDDSLCDIYIQNFGVIPFGDIRKAKINSIPSHQILCAGFPCQPFSKAGDQNGFDCPDWGDLFDRVVKIIRLHEPEFVLLENVPNLIKHDRGKTWNSVVRRLKLAGYGSDARILSPHQFGVPQIRERVYIIAKRGGLQNFVWPEPKTYSDLHVKSILDKDPKDAKPLTKQVMGCLEMWQRFVKKFPTDKQLPSFPIWAMEFGADYPYEGIAPAHMRPADLRKYRGAYGKSLADVPNEKIMAALPVYARADNNERFPDWKIEFILKNRTLYLENKAWIDEWKDELLAFPPSLQKLEWNCKGGVRDIWKYVLQFRASGVRVKKPTTAPSLIAMTATQVPIIAWEKRYMTPRECAKLQSMESLSVLPEASTAAYKALGNAINVHVMGLVAKALLGESHHSSINVKKETMLVAPQRRGSLQNAAAA
jgi:DNA (cytosine-5)-methyltransferase 1